MLLKMPDRVVVFRVDGFEPAAFSDPSQRSAEGPRLANFAPPLAAGGLEFTGLPSSLVAGSVPDVPAFVSAPTFSNAVQQVRRNDHVDS